MFAALEDDGPDTGLQTLSLSAGKQHKDSRKAEKAAEATRAAAEKAARAAATSAVVRVKELHGKGGGGGVAVRGSWGAGGLDMHGDVPTYIQGGALLAVTVQRAVLSEAPDLALPSRCGTA